MKDLFSELFGTKRENPALEKEQIKINAGPELVAMLKNCIDGDTLKGDAYIKLRNYILNNGDLVGEHGRRLYILKEK